MKPRKLTVTITKTTQIVQYEPLVSSSTVEYDLDLGEDLAKAQAKAIAAQGETVRKAMIRLENKFKEDEDKAE
jgi:hypothetical protein